MNAHLGATFSKSTSPQSLNPDFLERNFSKVLGSRVAYSCCSVHTFLHHKGCEWFTYDIASTDYNTVFATGRYIVALEKFYNTGRGSRVETGQSDRLATHIYGMEAVYVL